MTRRAIVPALLALTLGLGLAPISAAAQGKGQAKKHDETVLSSAQRLGLEGALSRREMDDLRGRQVGNGAGKVPPGWCQGVGNPHRTVQNCGYLGADRHSGGQDRYPRLEGASYDRAHVDFHRYLDRKYDELGSRRRTDAAYQLRLRLDKRAEHERWHEDVGIRH